MAEEKYNRKNPSVKRILQEIKEMQENPSDEYMSLPLEENIFEWQFAVCGPRDSEFEGGIYHGRIQLPAEYPLKPPSFLMLTPNGRFETQTKICLSISNYHPEHWQPSWSVRTALVALIAFMPTNPDGALGSLDFKKEERRLLAIKSREAAPKYGSPERQRLIDEIHQYLLKKVPPIPKLAPLPSTIQAASNVEAGDNEVTPAPAPDGTPVPDGLMDDLHEVQLNANAGPLRVSFAAGVGLRTASVELREQQQMTGREPQRSSEDQLYTWAAIALTVAILVLVVKKYMKSTGIAGFQDDS